MGVNGDWPTIDSLHDVGLADQDDHPQCLRQTDRLVSRSLPNPGTLNLSVSRNTGLIYRVVPSEARVSFERTMRETQRLNRWQQNLSSSQ